MKNKNLFRFLMIMITLFIIVSLTNHLINKFYQKKVSISYNTLSYNKNDLSIKYPNFDSTKINKKIKKIIESFNIKEGKVTYEAFVINNKYLSIIFSLPNYEYKSYLIDTSTASNLSLNTIVKDEQVIYKTIESMLNSKYPKFIVNNVELKKASFLFKDNEMYAYFSPKNIKPKLNEAVHVKINYHEIYNELKIPYTLDLEYLNENIYKLDKDKKTVAITFDDGPHKTLTQEAIKILKDNKAIGTFFMLGSKMPGNEELIKTLIANGNEIGSHSYNHKYLARISKKAMQTEIAKANEVNQKILGENIKFFRVPYGSINENVRKEINAPIIRWSVDPSDWKYKNAEIIKNNILNAVKDGDIILLHDVHKTSIEALRIVLPELYVRGYQVVNVSTLANLKDKALESNTVYNRIR